MITHVSPWVGSTAGQCRNSCTNGPTPVPHTHSHTHRQTAMAESRTGNEGYVCVSVFERATMGSKVERKSSSSQTPINRNYRPTPYWLGWLLHCSSTSWCLLMAHEKEKRGKKNTSYFSALMPALRLM